MLSRGVALVRQLWPELAKFGVVGLIGLVVDAGGFNLLRFAGGEGPLYDYPLTAKVVSTTAATIVSWIGHRYWTFQHSRRSAIHHEFLWFTVMCTIGSGIAVGTLWLSHYVFGFTSVLADNIAANVIGLGLGTAFRYWSYRTFVFSEHAVHPDEDDTAASATPADAEFGEGLNVESAGPADPA